MSDSAKIVATSANTITITLPDGIAVTPGGKVPPELLEMLAGYFALKSTGSLSGAEGCGPQKGCTVQVGAD